MENHANVPNVPEGLDWVILDSSNLNAVAYDDGVEPAIYVMFKSGPTYRYTPESVSGRVSPLDDYVDLLDAPSAGKFLHQQIVPFYRAERL